MVPRACADSSGMDSFMASAGAARIAMMAAAARAADTGCRWITPAHRCAAGILAERAWLSAPAAAAAFPARPSEDTSPPHETPHVLLPYTPPAVRPPLTCAPSARAPPKIDLRTLCRSRQPARRAPRLTSEARRKRDAEPRFIARNPEWYCTVASGAGVFASGTMRWVCTMRGPHCGHGLTRAAERFVDRATQNLLRAFAAGPAGRSHPARDNVAQVRPPRITALYDGVD
jgi:hypothetical protein